MATGAAIAGGLKVAGGVASGVAGGVASKKSDRQSDSAVRGIEDFVASGDYDPGGSQSTGTSFSESLSGGSSDSNSQGTSFNSSSNSSFGNSSSSSNSQSGYNLDNAQGLLDEWEETYGGIEDNLSDYYNNLDPAKYSTQYKTDLNANIDKQLSQVNDEMASSGLMSAGMKAQGAKEAAFAKATGGAQADLMAEDKVRSMQTNFLNRGDGIRDMANNALTGVSSTSSSNSSSASGSVGGSLGTSQNTSDSTSSNFGSSVSGSENQSSSRGSNYAPIQDIANIKSGQAAQSAQDSAGFVKGGIDLIGDGIGGLLG